MMEAVASPVQGRNSTLGLTRSDIVVGVLLALVMLVGGYFRFVGQNWDDFVRWHPDERFLSGVAASLNGPLSFTDLDLELQLQNCLARYPDTGGKGGFFDAECSNMNPNNTGSGLYVYGTLPAFLVRWTADVVVTTTGQTVWGTYTAIHLVGRALSALAEMGVILVVFFIGVQLHGRWTGLLAAILYACAVFSIQQAHFWTADAMTNLFCALAIWCAIRVQDGGGLGSYLEFGLFFGMALASRINTAPLVGLLLLAAGVRLLPVLDRRMSWHERWRVVNWTLLGLVLAGGMTILAFRILNPYAFTGPGFFGLKPNPRWLEDLGQAQHLVSGMAESAPNWQWVGRTGYVFPFGNMVLWGMGLALGLAGWAAWVWSGWRLIRGREGALRNLLPVVWIAVYFGWLGNLWVMSMRYYLPMYPMFAVLAAWALVELVRRADQAEIEWRKLAARGLLVAVAGFTLLWALMFTNIYRSLFAPAQSSYWVSENLPADFSMEIEGADDAPLVNIAVLNAFGGDETPLEQLASRYEDGHSLIVQFTATGDGVISTVHSPHLGDPNDDADEESLRVRISSADGGIIVAEGTLTADLARDTHVLGRAYDIPLDTPITVKQGEVYSFTVEVLSGGPVISAGPVFAWEGDWDEVSLPKVCGLPPGVTLADNPPPGLAGPLDCQGRDLWSAQTHSIKLQIFYDEETYKRDLMQRGLDNSDYLIISTNRRYDSQSRIPYRWPMTMRFYDALFDGSLGYELVETFQETFEFGPFRVSDQVLPTYDGPEWLNEFEAEEAFHVYDHPAVFIFRKTGDYSAANTAHILNSATLNKTDIIPPGFDPRAFNDPGLVGVIPLYSVPADAAPTLLRFTPEQAEMQYSNGTWSERFHSQSSINTQPLVTILAWWGTMLVFGWVTWPLLFALFPGLADRGYTFAKMAGLLLTGWLAWFVSSARIPMWSQNGVLAALLLLAALSAYLGWRRRGELWAYVRQYGMRLAWIETITLLLFVVFLLIRLTNPDLWHPSFGGEKPMDFAYFNGVLRSTVFPPIDPWHAGGYINYYYFGYVIVGAPVLLLGMMPSIAYNLIIPTLFALTGIGAFGAAFNVVSAWRGRKTADSDDTAGEDTAQPEGARRLANPWVAGLAALVMAVVLGNLDTPRVFISEGLMRTGYYQQPLYIEQELVQDFTTRNGRAPEGAELDQITAQANAEAASPFSSAWRGLLRTLNGQPLDMAPNRWYWAATRILSEPPVLSGGAIAEMPFFTFLYGDLHAHMIAMPMLYMVMAFVLNEVLSAGKDGRSWLSAGLALALGALVAGLLRATNTWDWITFMLLSVLGLGFAWWLSIRRINRRSLVTLGIRVGGFVALSFLFALPYTTWYAAIYSRAMAWEGPKSPFWTYFTIHGLFLFLVFSLLVWDTGRWLRSVYVRSLRGTWLLLLAGVLMVAFMLIGALILSVAGWTVTIVAVPFLIWIAILFLREGQSREMRYILALAGLAVALTLGVEYVVLEGDLGRQNTVFKFYIQAWLLFSVVGGVAVAWLLSSSARWSGGIRTVWYTVGMLLVTAAAFYPIMAARGRALDRMASEAPLSLDGMEYMKYALLYEGNVDVITSDPTVAPFALIDDYNMIRWMQENIQGTPVIMEGQSDREYRWQSRVAITTGLPAVIGWNFHQRQQRTFDPLPQIVQQRVANVNAFYSTIDTDIAWSILKRYDVGYVVVSSLERAYYTPAGLAKFQEMVAQGMLEVVYQQGKAIVYEVIKDADFDLVEEVAGGV